MKGFLKIENGELVVVFEVLSDFLTVNSNVEIQPKTEIKTMPVRNSDAMTILSKKIDITGKEIEFDEENYHYVSGGLIKQGEIGGKGLQHHDASYAKIKNLNLFLNYL